MRFKVVFGCGACQAAFRTVIEGRPCPEGTHNVHFPVEGIVTQWSAAHHQPGIIVLGSVKEET